MSNLRVLAPSQDDVQKMLAAKVHLGTTNCTRQMKDYIWKRRPDALHVINLEKTWEKLMLAARIICTIENPADVCVISSRSYGQRAVIKFAQHTGASQLPGRFTAGTFTNQIQKTFMEPRLLILADPHTDHQPLKEAAYVNIPTIAFCNTDSLLHHVDVAIPCNNNAKEAIGLMFWLLAREVCRMKGHIDRQQVWDVPVDLFFYRDPEEIKAQEEAAMAEAQGAADPAWGQEQGDEWQQQQAAVAQMGGQPMAGQYVDPAQPQPEYGYPVEAYQEPVDGQQQYGGFDQQPPAPVQQFGSGFDQQPPQDYQAQYGAPQGFAQAMPAAQQPQAPQEDFSSHPTTFQQVGREQW